MKKHLYILFTICLLCVSNQTVNAKTIQYVDKEAVEKSLQNISLSDEMYQKYLTFLETKASKVKATRSNHLPSSYDPRKTGEITSIKNQLPYGSCWSYGVMATAESALIKQHMEDNTIDLSEMQYMYKLWKELYPEEDYTDAFQHGGGILQVWYDMGEGIGPSLETDFDTPQAYDGKTYTEDDLKKKVYDLDTIYYTGYNETDINSLKQLIYTYGGASFNYYSGENYYISNPTTSSNKAYNNTGDSTYYCPYQITTINHMVEIVGWDDNYPKENFKYQPKNNGAWLIKNSWGEAYYGNFSDNIDTYLEENEEELAAPTGYYWISYEEYSGMNRAIVGATFALKDTQVTHIKATPTLDLYMQEEKTIIPTIIPNTATNKEVTYKSSNEEVATVTPNGVVKGIGSGTCTITITSKDIIDACLNESWATTEVEVTVKEESITILSEDLALEIDETDTIKVDICSTNANVLYESSDEEIATIDENGIITPKDYGVVTITATLKDTNISDQIEVIICRKEIICEEDYHFLYHSSYKEEERKGKELILKDKKGEVITGYASEYVNDSIFEVINGVVFPKSIGTGYIKVSIYDKVFTNGKIITKVIPIVVDFDQEKEASLKEEPTTKEPTTSISTEHKTEVSTTEITSETPKTEATTTEVVTPSTKVETTTESVTETTKKKVSIPKTKWVKVKRKGTKLTLKWKKVSGITSYKIQVSTNKKYKKKDTKTYTASKKTTSKTIKIKKNKTYYVRIQTIKKVKGKNYYSKWVNKTVKK